MTHMPSLKPLSLLYQHQASLALSLNHLLGTKKKRTPHLGPPHVEVPDDGMKLSGRVESGYTCPKESAIKM